MNKFEQLIEYVINDEEQKARELFHDIVVAKSRQIYENLMQEESNEDLDEAEDIEEGQEDLDEAEDIEEAEDVEEGAMGGDASDNLIDEIEADESQDMSMEGEEDDEGGDDFGGDEGGDDFGGDEGEPATKGDIMDLEDKLDQLMADFEELMNDAEDGEIDGDGDGFGDDEGGDAIEMDDTEEMMPMAEAVSLKAAPKPVTSEEGSVNKKSNVAANSGAAGMAAKPVHPTGTEAKGRPAPTTKDLITDFQNKAGAGMKDMTPATKPHLAQATGVNTKSPLPGGRKG